MAPVMSMGFMAGQFTATGSRQWLPETTSRMITATLFFLKVGFALLLLYL